VCVDGLCPPFPAVPNGRLCPDTDSNECTVAACVGGICSQTEPEAFGVPCDDDDERTTSDICSGDGECRGTDLCVDGVDGPIVCASPPSPCHEPDGTCFQGSCSYALKPLNGSCDDGEERTDFDRYAWPRACFSCTVQEQGGGRAGKGRAQGRAQLESSSS
jgi:hypothetical protein